MDSTSTQELEIESKIFDDQDIAYYRVRDQQDSSTYLCMVLHKSDPSAQDLRRFRQEYEISRKINSTIVPKARKLFLWGAAPAILFNDFDGIQLYKLIDNKNLSLDQKLEIAIKITHGIEEIHQSGVVHKNINPFTILVSPRSLEIRITGLAKASTVPQETQSLNLLPIMDRSLAYISPEQTGRMNRPLDYRSDFYALGATLFHFFAENPLFSGTDAIEMFHMHLAVEPHFPTKTRTKIPIILAQLLNKLLNKSPSERYQSAFGIRRDLEIILEQLHHPRPGKSLNLGEFDFSKEFHLSTRKLYGRESEINTLLDIFHRVAVGGRECLFIAGYSGVGKTSIVQEIQSPICRQRGLFVSGKYDQYHRDIPYHAFTSALSQLIRNIIGAEKNEVALWREKFVNALGHNAQVIFTILPELELIIGPQPDIQALGPVELQNRLLLFFKRFIQVFAHKDHPLVIFLDDMQWIDGASLMLLKSLLSDDQISHLMLIGAYRDNEVDSSHPLVVATKEEQRRGNPISHLHLAPLLTANISEMLVNTFYRSGAETESLALLLKEKTDGNPFFIGQLLSSFVQLGHIYCVPEERLWKWDIEQLKSCNISPNVVDLMVNRIQTLPHDTQELLKLCSLLGNQVLVIQLQKLVERPLSELIQKLWPAIELGLLTATSDAMIELQQLTIAPEKESFPLTSSLKLKFLHDRVQQAAYAMVEDRVRQKMHYEIGQKLQQFDDMEFNIFDIVNHLNLAVDISKANNQTMDLIKLNQAAGLKAKKSSANDIAATYFGMAASLLDASTWQNHSEISYAISFEEALCSYILADLEKAERLFLSLMERATSNLDKAKIQKVLVDLYTTKGDIPGAVECAIFGVRLLGIELYPHPTREQVLDAYEHMKGLLGDRNVEELIDLPIMTNPEMEVALAILATMMPPALFFDENLLYLEHILMVEISLKYGNAAPSCHGYSYFGMVLGNLLGDYELGYRFGKLGYDLVTKHNFQEFKAKVCLSFGSNVNFWVNHVKSDLPYLEEGFHSAVESGDVTYSCYHCNHIAMVLLASGTPLELVYQDIVQRKRYVGRTGYREIGEILVSKERLVQLLRGKTRSHNSYASDDFDEDAFEASVSHGMSIKTCWHYIHKLEANYRFGNLKEALESAEKARPLLWSSVSHVELPDYYLFYALTLAADYQNVDEQKKKLYDQEMLSCCEILGKWRKSCESNFAHKHALVQAEMARLTGSFRPAVLFYEEAISTALKDGFVQYVALAYELLAKYYIREGAHTICHPLIDSSLRYYGIWGAQGKIAHLKQELAHITQKKDPAIQESLSSPKEEVVPHDIDVAAMIKASQAIASELNREKILRSLLIQLLEYVAASRGALIENHDDGPKVAAIITPDKNVTIAPPCDLIDEYCSSNIVMYALRTGKVINLDDAYHDASYQTDPYIRANKVRSLLCVPLMYLGKKTERAIFLENNLVTDAFYQHRRQLIEVLLTQATIALENADFYSRIQASEAKYRQLHETMRDAFSLATIDGEILEVNQAYRDMTGYTNEELKSLAYSDITPAKWHDYEAAVVRDKIMVYGDSQVYEKEYIHKNGTIFPVELRKFLIKDTNNEPTAIWGIIRDISERKKQERELREAKDLAETASRSKSDFLANMSHELRTPLNGLLGFSQLLIAGTKDVSSLNTKYAEIIYNSGIHLLGLINNVLDFSRIEADKTIIHEQQFSMEKLIKDIDMLYRERISKKDLYFNTEIKDITGVFRSDMTKIKQILINLVDNAYKFTVKGGITITVSTLASNPDGTAKIMFSVRDSGIGIDEKKQQHLFEKFEQGEHYLTKKHRGIGLGLAIVKGLVDLMHGQISVKTELNVGTEFVVILPLTQAK